MPLASVELSSMPSLRGQRLRSEESIESGDDIYYNPTAVTRGNKLTYSANNSNINTIAELKEEECLQSKNGKYKLVMHDNGKLVLYDSSQSQQNTIYPIQTKLNSNTNNNNNNEIGTWMIKSKSDPNPYNNNNRYRQGQRQPPSGGRTKFNQDQNMKSSQDKPELESSTDTSDDDSDNNINIYSFGFRCIDNKLSLAVYRVDNVVIWEAEYVKNLHYWCDCTCSLVLENSGSLRLQNEDLTTSRVIRVISDNNGYSPLHNYYSLDYIGINNDNYILGDSWWTKDDITEEKRDSLSDEWKSFLNNSRWDINGCLEILTNKDNKLSLFMFILMILPFWIVMSFIKAFAAQSDYTLWRVKCFMTMFPITYYWIKILSGLLYIWRMLFELNHEQILSLLNKCSQWLQSYKYHKHPQLPTSRWASFAFENFCNVGVCVNESIPDVLLAWTKRRMLKRNENGCISLNIKRFITLVGPIIIVKSWASHCKESFFYKCVSQLSHCMLR